MHVTGVLVIASGILICFCFVKLVFCSNTRRWITFKDIRKTSREDFDRNTLLCRSMCNGNHGAMITIQWHADAIEYHAIVRSCQRHLIIWPSFHQIIVIISTLHRSIVIALSYFSQRSIDQRIISKIHVLLKRTKVISG